MYFKTFVPLKFSNVGEPLLIRLRGEELAVKKVFGKILRILGLSRAAIVVVLDGGFYVLCPTDAKYPLVIDVDIVVVSQIIVDTAVAFVRAFHMDFLDLFRKPLVFGNPAALVPRRPFMVGGTGDMK